MPETKLSYPQFLLARLRARHCDNMPDPQDILPTWEERSGQLNHDTAIMNAVAGETAADLASDAGKASADEAWATLTNDERRKFIAVLVGLPDGQPVSDQFAHFSFAVFRNVAEYDGEPWSLDDLDGAFAMRRWERLLDLILETMTANATDDPPARSD